MERFLQAAGEPALIEPGEDPFALHQDNYELTWCDGRLSLAVWDQYRHLRRRILGLAAEKSGRLELFVEHFPKREARIYLIDLAKPKAGTVVLRAERYRLRERFRLWLHRCYPEWRIVELSADPDIEHSLSSVHPRAFLCKGASGLAAIAAAAEGEPAEASLAFGLIWLDYLRRTRSKQQVEGLVVFLPYGRERTACLRLLHLDRRRARFTAWTYTPDDLLAPIDLADHGNIETKLTPVLGRTQGLSPRVEAWIAQLREIPEVEVAPRAGGMVTLRIHGLEFAWAEGDKFWFGLDRKLEAEAFHLTEIAALAHELSRLRAPNAANRDNPLWRERPEAWLESQVRKHLRVLDPTLCADPVYGQIPALAAGERGVLDLLAVDQDRRLAILELKASEDLQLPLQALDYWIRVKWFLGRGDFEACGYFPGVALRRTPPRLLLITPALEYHPTTGVILKYLSPEIPVEQIGVGAAWRSRFQVVFRRKLPGRA